MSGKTALVTGAFSGIGRATAIKLVRHGYTVFAGALNEGEAAAISVLNIPTLIPVVMDIRDITSIDAAINLIADHLGETRPLDALVNVAGINLNAPLHVMSVDEVRLTIEVNLLGTILLTRAAVPLLRRGPGRVVLVGSATAFLPPPTISVYAATKCGLGGFGDALRVELGMAGLSVSIVEPGVVKTPLTAGAPKVLEGMLGRMSSVDRGLYEKLMRKIVQMSSSPGSGIPPDLVATAIVDALTVKRPRSRYRVGTDSKIAAVLALLPDGIRDFIQRKTFGI